MSFNASSFFSPAEDTFLNKRNPIQQSNLKNSNMLSSLPLPSTGKDQPELSDIYERTIYPETSLAHNLSANPISPYVPIKSLVESPFKPSHAHAHSTPLVGPSSSYYKETDGVGIQTPSKQDSMNAESILKMKIKAHQRQFQENMNTMQAGFNLTDKQVSQETYLNSAFKPRRSTAEISMTHLKDIGSGNFQNGATKNNNSNNNINASLEPLRMSSYNGKISYTTDKKGANISVIQSLDNPYVAEALGRIVNKELEMRKLLYGTLAFLVYRFLRSIIKLFVYTNPMVAKSSNKLSRLIDNFSKSIENEKVSLFVKWISQLFTFESVLKVGSYIEYFMGVIFAIIIVSTLYRLLKPQDKCLDLPLSKAQRKILGLVADNDETTNKDSAQGKGANIADDEDDEEEEAIMKKLLSSSPQKIEQPTRVVMPSNQGIDDVMGSLNSLAISNAKGNSANMTWSSGMSISKANTTGSDNLESIKNKLNQRNSFVNANRTDSRNGRDFLSPNGKYMFGVNEELRQQNGFGTRDSSFY